MQNNMDMKISGSGTVKGGEYGTVSVSGSAKLNGNVTCMEFRCSGSVKAEGDLECENDIRISGSFSCEGSLKAGGAIKISGSCKSGGEVRAKEIHVSGGLKAEGTVSGEEVRISGNVATDGDVEGERVKLSGNARIGGMLNGETVEIMEDTAGGMMKIPTIGGTNITVYPQRKKRGFFGIKKYTNQLISDLIEGDTVDLSDTECNTVRGKNVVIRKNCKIGRVEYSESLTVDPESTVTEQEKV